MVRNTYIYPPTPSMRIISDIFAYTSQKMPKFNSISISGYHMQEAGATADLELAYTLADGLSSTCAPGIAAGLDVDAFAPRLSFFWAIGMNFFMEVAKLRAARLLWASWCRHFAPKNEKSLSLRTHCQTSGWSLTAQDVYNNVMRTCVEAMAARRATRRACTPTRSTRRSRCRPTSRPASPATRSSCCSRSRAPRASIDPWGGSYYVERLTARRWPEGAGAHRRRSRRWAAWRRPSRQGMPKLRIEEAARAPRRASTKAEQAKALAAAYVKANGRKPKIYIAKMGQDGHDRGQKVVASALMDLGWEVEIGPLFQTPEEAAADARKAGVDIVAASSLAAGHLTLVPELKRALGNEGAANARIIVGGVIPPQDFDALRTAGAAAIFPPGTVIADSAIRMLELLSGDPALTAAE
jgi:methylmalonyl-CoA mutase cobalamin-binding domain/chain